VELGDNNITDVNDPGFKDRFNRDFSLDESSPCRGAGVAIEGVTPVGIEPNMGAFPPEEDRLMNIEFICH